jgi:hypothetical protein
MRTGWNHEQNHRCDFALIDARIQHTKLILNLEKLFVRVRNIIVQPGLTAGSVNQEEMDRLVREHPGPEERVAAMLRAVESWIAGSREQIEATKKAIMEVVNGGEDVEMGQ